MRDDADRLVYPAAGALAAILLAIALTPLREATTAANLAFPFLILTIVAAEYGGRWGAITTALVSAMSLDFFLTQPYRTLSIASKHDAITFVALTVCGLVVAAFGSARSRTIAAMRQDRARLDLMRGLVDDLAAGRSAAALSRPLEQARGALSVTACVVRRADGEIVAASDRAFGLVAPREAASFDAVDSLTAEGVQIPLETGGRRVGWLDLWGRGAKVDDESRRTLIGLGRVAALMLAR